MVKLSTSPPWSSSSFTYRIGQSLYVPLTSCCNTRTLPETRGPAFPLPAHVIHPLLLIRQAELSLLLPTSTKDDALVPTSMTQTLSDWNKNEFLPNTTQPSDRSSTILVTPVSLPPRMKYSQTCRLYQDRSTNILQDLISFQKKSSTSPKDEIYFDDGRLPSISTLTQEILDQLLRNPSPSHPTTSWTNQDHTFTWDSIVFAGEGEPTLRLPAIISISQSIRRFFKDTQNSIPTNHVNPNIPIRVMTNGLMMTFPDFIPFQEPYSNNSPPSKKILSFLKDSGVTDFTVSLNTASPEQYIQIMEPIPIQPFPHLDGNHRCTQHPSHVHTVVCDFIQSALSSGFQVEVTGIDRPEIQKDSLEQAVVPLGVTTPIRWRSYHVE